MEEVDAIILHSLRLLEIGIDEEAKSVEDLQPNAVVKAVMRCVEAIDGAVEMPETVPRNMSARVGLCSELCELIKGMGYRDALGYHQLVYANATENRRLLSWLVGRLPNTESSKPAASSAGGFSSRVFDVISSDLKEFWVPSFTAEVRGKSRQKNASEVRTEWLQSPFKVSSAPKNIDEHYRRTHMKYWSGQVTKGQERVGPSVLEYNAEVVSLAADWENEWNTLGLKSGLDPQQYRAQKKQRIGRAMATAISASLQGSHAHLRAGYGGSPQGEGAGRNLKGRMKGSRFTHQVEYSDRVEVAQIAEESEQEKEERRKNELEVADSKLANAEVKVKALLEEIETFQTNFKQIEANLFAEQQRTEQLKRDLLVKRKTMSLLPQADENMEKLRQMSEDQANRIQQLAKKWETLRYPLVDEYRKLKANAQGKKGDIRGLLAEIKRLREEIEKLKLSAKQRYDRYKQLMEVWNSMPKDISRETYTVRILDIVRQTKKQKVDIDKILVDTRNINKDINKISEALFRSFSVTSELVFQDAVKIPVAKQAYKILASMHEQFEALVGKVGETGSLRRDILTLEEKYQQLCKRVGSMNLDQILSDLQQLKQEN